MSMFHSLVALMGLVVQATPGSESLPQAITPQLRSAASLPILTLPGREADARVARIALRIASAGVRWCPTPQPATGIVLQHLTQFELRDRAGVLASLPLDRGPGVIVVVPGSPAALAGVEAGDVLLAINGRALPPEGGIAAPFAASAANARADAISDLLAAVGANPVALTLLRDGSTVSLQLSPLPACPSRVHLARSGQRNAYADGRHVFLTTGLLAQLHGDDELAFVIAHEMAHNILGHAAIMRGGSVERGLGRMLGRSGNIVRTAEREADRLAAEMMIDAGIDPVRGAALLERIGSGLDLLSAHDSPAERIAVMRTVSERRTR